MNYKRLTKWTDYGTLHIFDFCGREVPLSEATALDNDCIAGRLAELEDKIERGENDYVDAIETEQRIIDLITEFDEMGFAPTTLHPDPEQYAIDWRDQVRKEFARLITENAALKKRLENAIELPCMQCVITLEWIDVEKRAWHCFKQWVVLYNDSCDQIVVEHCTSKDAAEARLEELKGG